jgi:vacuolar-type H+-ATPase subunit I/STV1
MKLETQVRLDLLIKSVGTTKSLILHSWFFVIMLCLPFFGVNPSLSLLILTTVVSLEAIYLNIFIQMGVNRHADEQKETKEVLTSLEETIDDVQETIEDVQETVEDVQETIDEEENEHK